MAGNGKLVLAACAILVAVAAVLPASAGAPALELLEVRRIWDKAKHNAFTDLIRHPDLIRHQGLLWVSYYSSHEGKTSIYLAKLSIEP